MVELLPEDRARLYPVGRLDADSTGLILLTNDGELANRLTHPRYEVPKTYRARVGGGPVTDAALRPLRAGVELEDGPTAPARRRRLGRRTLELTIREGRNRQVRRMCEAVGHPVLELERVASGRCGSAGSRRASTGGCDATRGRRGCAARSDRIAAHATVRPARRHQRRATTTPRRSSSAPTS